MVKFNNTYFYIVLLLFILDQVNAKRRGGIVIYSDGEPGVSGLEVVQLVWS